jgi:hypothetical protein
MNRNRSRRCRSGRHRGAAASRLVNESVEAADHKQLSKTNARHGCVDLLCSDELGYMEFDRRVAEPPGRHRRALEQLRDILTSDGRRLAQAALRALWARIERIIPILGFKTVAQVQDNAAALQRGPIT